MAEEGTAGGGSALLHAELALSDLPSTVTTAGVEIVVPP